MMNNQKSKALIKISKLSEDKISISFLYNPEYLQKIKTIYGYPWHPKGKYWSFPNTNGTLKKILSIFKNKKIHLNPALQNVIVKNKVVPAAPEKQFQAEANKISSPPVGEDKGEGDFKDLRKELLSRKYSYKTVKAYIISIEIF